MTAQISMQLNGQTFPGQAIEQALVLIPNLNNILEQVHPYVNLGAQGAAMGGPPHTFVDGGQVGGTFFAQDGSNAAYYSSNGHQIHLQGAGNADVHIGIDQMGNPVYAQGDLDREDEVLDEFPIDDYNEEVDQLDEDGEPEPSAEEVRDIINSIPSYKFEEEVPDGLSESSRASRSKQSSKKGPSQNSMESFTERKRREIKRQEKEVSCSICLEVLKTGMQVKALQCKHVFHTNCIHSWLKQKLMCPNCKMKVRLC